VLAGTTAYAPAATELAASALLPAAERRRTGVPVKLALAIAQEACGHAGREPATIASVFTSSSGDGETVHHIFEALSQPEREVSPTRFHNSVHNAAAGYWSIAAQSREPSTSLCCYDASFAAGLLDATVQAKVEQIPVVLIAYDQPYPEPLHSKRPLPGVFGVALVLAPLVTSRTLAHLDVSYATGAREPTRMSQPELEKLRSGIPAARSLPLLAAFARNDAADIVLEYTDRTHLRITTTPHHAALDGGRAT
jgi:Beta-ketoacyl synthase, N-terminal domain